MQADNIAVTHQTVQVSLFYSCSASWLAAAYQHVHMKGITVFCHFFPDMPKSDKADCFFRKFGSAIA